MIVRRKKRCEYACFPILNSKNKKIFSYFKLSYSKFARDLQKTQTQNPILKKLKTQTQTDMSE